MTKKRKNGMNSRQMRRATGVDFNSLCKQFGMMMDMLPEDVKKGIPSQMPDKIEVSTSDLFKQINNLVREIDKELAELKNEEPHLQEFDLEEKEEPSNAPVVNIKAKKEASA